MTNVIGTIGPEFYRFSRRFALAVVLLMSCLAVPQIYAAEALQELSLEQLMTVQVTSASRKMQTLGEVAGAMYVISAEDIRRSGVTSVAEALRMVPGVHVGRIDDTRWAVSARGFNDQLSNKLLVMMDGRHIYTPDFAGVFWSDHMPLIDNVERIEVIRGPGATIWGSNAVNGVINIISRSARDTQGVFLQARGGNRDIQGGSARYGGVTESGWFYRLDFHTVTENITDSPLDAVDNDFLDHNRASFRVDGTPREDQSLRIEGSYYSSSSKEVAQIPNFGTGSAAIDIIERDVDSEGSWLMADWRYEDSQNSSWNVSSYIEGKSRASALGKYTQNTFNLQMQRRWLLGENHDLIWGFGSRFIDLPFEERSALVVKLPGYEDKNNIYEFFLQDEISLNDSLALTLGSKFEKSDFVDWQVQPNARISWQVREDTAFWASASRAVRTPSSTERGVRIQPGLVIPPFTGINIGPIPVGLQFDGSKDFQSEELDALEFGMKGQLGDRFSYDLAFFDFRYEQLLSGVTEGVFCEPQGLDILDLANIGCLFDSDYLVARTALVNDPAGKTQGAELSFNWQPLDNWRLTGSFSWFDYKLDDVPTSPTAESIADPQAIDNTRDEPERIGYLRSEWTITPELEFDLTLRAVSESELFDIDAYTTADVRLEWKPRADLRFELIGQNLLDRGHTEYGSRALDALPSAVNSSVIARITWAP